MIVYKNHLPDHVTNIIYIKSNNVLSLIDQIIVNADLYDYDGRGP